ncbi:MAG: hypothetical protein VW268_10560 [Rhodospirillaceae bacterium]
MPISIAFRINGRKNAEAFCKDIAKVEREVNAFMRRNVGSKFKWTSVATSGLDKKLADRVNGSIGGGTTERVLMAAGDQGAEAIHDLFTARQDPLPPPGFKGVSVVPLGVKFPAGKAALSA